MFSCFVSLFDGLIDSLFALVSMTLLVGVLRCWVVDWFVDVLLYVCMRVCVVACLFGCSFELG